MKNRSKKNMGWLMALLLLVNNLFLISANAIEKENFDNKQKLDAVYESKQENKIDAKLGDENDLKKQYELNKEQITTNKESDISLQVSYNNAILLNSDFINSTHEKGIIQIPFKLYCFGGSYEKYYVEIYNSNYTKVAQSSGYFLNTINIINLTLEWDASNVADGTYYVRHWSTYDSTLKNYYYPFQVENNQEVTEEILYQTHVQDYGWQEWKSNGEMSGTSGEGKRLEGIRIKLGDTIPTGANIVYRTHIQDYGWQNWKSNGEMSGTSGEGKRLEGIEIKLENAPGYTVEYRTHVEDYGWQEWKSDGEMSGTSGEGKRLEGIEIRIKKKEVKDPNVVYRTHVQDYGWQEWKLNGEMSGTSGEGKRLEGIEIKADNLPQGANIVYRTHVEDYGWQEWKSNGEMSGTSGKGKRLEGIEIKLENALGYSVEYRTHVEDYGWQEWKSNGEMSGTSGKSKRLEGIEVRIVKK